MNFRSGESTQPVTSKGERLAPFVCHQYNINELKKQVRMRDPRLVNCYHSLSSLL